MSRGPRLLTFKGDDVFIPGLPYFTKKYENNIEQTLPIKLAIGGSFRHM